MEPLDWAKPLSSKLIEFVLLKHVINRYGAQMLASRRQMALVYIVRAKGNELGPFVNDGPFVAQVLSEMAALTGGAFKFGAVEAFTFSSGIHDFNPFVRSMDGVLKVDAVYNIDPYRALAAFQPNGAIRKQYLSGSTGGPRAGFEFLGLERWRNEFGYAERERSPQPWRFNYLHNRCMPLYTLHLALQT